MSVKTWFSISAAVLIAIVGAAAFRFFIKPFDPPAIIATTANAKLDGQLVSTCWPDRGNKPRCIENDVKVDSSKTELPSRGSIRLVVAFPQEPVDGSVSILRGNQTVKLFQGWQEKLDYTLDDGEAYVVEAEARYPSGSFVVYQFGFTTKR